MKSTELNDTYVIGLILKSFRSMYLDALWHRLLSGDSIETAHKIAETFIFYARKVGACDLNSDIAEGLICKDEDKNCECVIYMTRSEKTQINIYSINHAYLYETSHSFLIDKIILNKEKTK